ncbi:MAG: hypothetical protein ACOX7P_09400 [Oscillospiraceae bacterium]
MRNKLTDTILSSPARLVYIHAGAGYGKTTLLSQAANRSENAVWLSLDGESDVLTFIDTMCGAIKLSFPEFDFFASEYLPFSEKHNFISMLAGALICSIENIAEDFLLVMDDLHTIEDDGVKKFIACLVKYPPRNARLCFGSREAPWQDFLTLKIKGGLTELSQKELAFTREETAEILGFDDSAVYACTEGWPLAVRSFRVLLENGISLSDVTFYGRESLYDYLFRECIANLNSDMVDFLKKSACFDELDAQMLDDVLNKKIQGSCSRASYLGIFSPSRQATGFTATTRFSEAGCWKREIRTRFLCSGGKRPGTILTVSSIQGRPGTPLS